MAREPIVIKNWTKETAPSAYLGFEEIRGLDTKNKPGAILASDALVKESAATVDDEIFDTTIDDNGVLYGISQENGDSVFKRLQDGTWSELSGFGASPISGIAFFMGNIILIHTNGSLDASVNDGAAWTNAFDTITNNSNLTSPTIVAQDGFLYICQGNDVDYLSVGAVDFDPTGSEGDNWAKVLKALQNGLPPQYEIRSVVALGDDLMLGTINNDDENDATIFPWDRQSVSFTQPIRIKENGVRYLIEVENLLYVCAGVKGRWYVTNGTSVNFLAEIPKTMFDLTNINLDMSLNNAVAYNEGLIFFGVSYENAGANNKLGVYSLNPKTGRINFAHIISKDVIGVQDGVKITSITKAIRTISGVAKESIVVCWLDVDDTSHGADALTNVKYTGDRAFFVTQFLSIGLSVQENSFNRPELRLTRPLASGDSLKIWTRRQQGGDWKLHYTEARIGFQNGFMKPISDIKDIQVKGALNQDTELLDITLI